MIRKLLGAIQMASEVNRVQKANGFKRSSLLQTLDFIWTVFRA